ncbi:hypothetical protein [Streptomyces sudanensis]|uniref:hypothetical protein n=1 Tax=Streptomyces sudanensis TaxID=436397 RepID=UPI0020CC2749|nr:hypothetical protein [Streptomyces sudanensis]MCP9958872.1 hypothetical protein [Streptomyces sudanensis]MCQ0000650.1 hypothetical protein [Streptomyces sudanensis]
MAALRTAAVAAVLVLVPAAGPPGAGPDRPDGAPGVAEPAGPHGSATPGAPSDGGGAVANAPSVAGQDPGTRHTVAGLALAAVAAVAVAARSAHRGRTPEPGGGS